ncbi:thioredoxin domain-containing protein [Aquimarina hainanensis]|uniref:Thioredoxin domain-containing protein n=1 Tax=Aquimarina hainanensis TaxID=1578017 RepID=A0ABW5N6J2_9FLAO
MNINLLLEKLFLILLIMLLSNCSDKKKSTITEPLYTNDLIHETSPYLLQHAHNPVNWKPWNNTALTKAREENKLIIISVGYAACHWCHVMEEESFENKEVAELMNKNFIAIKIDREERPDIDQIYMKAVQLMTGSGGWPLNVIALPDGRPIWGGTYFPKESWLTSLEKIVDVYQKEPAKLYEYADKLEQGIKTMDLIPDNTTDTTFDKAFIQKAVDSWSTLFDHTLGGIKKSPKFMMPNNYHFLLRYAHQKKDSSLLKYTLNTLSKMSYGGVYDHIGGGFSRYSTDEKWHVPHFEKMLYDNAQLVSLYADAYLATKDSWYKTVVYETLEFVSNELTNEEGAFFSSLDADSMTPQQELEEGAFYVWKKDELKSLLKEEYDIFAKYYNINSYGIWEENKYVLIKNENDSLFAQQQNMSIQELDQAVLQWKSILLSYRNKRKRPRLDDKTLTSWNALMIKGYVDAYRVFGEKKFLDAAVKNANFIKKHLLKKDFSLFHNYKNGVSSINGYLEDYASVIEAYIQLYQITAENEWLFTSQKLAEYTLAHFYDAETTLFYFTSDKDPKLISRTIDYTDNVIPSSNSIMAKNLFLLSHYLDQKKYNVISTKMIQTILPKIEEYPSGYSNWLDVMLNYTYDFYEVVISGPQASNKLPVLNRHYIPNKLLAVSDSPSDMPLLKDRYIGEDTFIFVCVQNTCKLPVESVDEAVSLIENNN